MNAPTKLVEEIIKIEWDMFSNVNGSQNKASCQENSQTFCYMRIAQALIWQTDTLMSYLQDLSDARTAKINLMTEKYARMMQSTHPDEYLHIKDQLRPLDPQVSILTDQIMTYFKAWEEDIDRRFAKIRALKRQENDTFYNTSATTYLHGELLTYSTSTLTLCLRDVQNAYNNQVNLAEKILEKIAEFYGYSSLAQLESRI